MNAHSPAPLMPQLDTGEFRRALGAFPTGVTVVTTLDDDGQLHGLTANAFSSVSLDPPLVLVCVNYRSRSYRRVVEAGRFAVHILSEDQADIARVFASPGVDRGSLVNWALSERGLPVLDRYVSLLECSLEAEHAGGDHAILVGRVESIDNAGDHVRPLLYHRGRMLQSPSA